MRPHVPDAPHWPAPAPEDIWEEAQRRLFAPRVRPDRDPGTRLRPLEPVSSFVVEELPLALERALAGGPSARALARTLEVLAAQADPRLVRELADDPGALDLASLEVNFLVAAAFHGGPDRPAEEKGVGPRLTRLATTMAGMTGKIPVPSYEDLVLANPLELEPRLLTAGGDGEAERDFYLAHLLIERCFDRAIALLGDAVSALLGRGSEAIPYAAALVSEATECVATAARITRHLGAQLDPQRFTRFRRYFFPIRLGGRTYPGPSGRYTAGLPIIEVLASDEHFVPRLTPELDPANPEHLRDHFPRRDVAVLDAAVATARSGASIGRLLHALGSPPELRQAAELLCSEIHAFRLGHRHAVRLQIPESVRKQPVAGSGGVTDIDAYLSHRLDYRHITFDREVS